MKIYFCDQCNGSIPLVDLTRKDVRIESGRITCRSCSRAAGPMHRLPLAAVGLLLAILLLVVGAFQFGSLTTERRLEATTRNLQNRLVELEERQSRHEAFEDRVVELAARLRETEKGVGFNARAARQLFSSLASSRDTLHSRIEENRRGVEHRLRILSDGLAGLEDARDGGSAALISARRGR